MENISSNFPCIQFHLLPERHNFSKNRSRKYPFRACFWVNLRLQRCRLCARARVFRCVCACCVVSAAKVHSLCCSVADWNQDFRVNGQGDGCLLDVSAFVTRSAHRSRHRRHRRPLQGNTAAEYIEEKQKHKRKQLDPKPLKAFFYLISLITLLLGFALN